ncbi:MAG: indolepyruvate ferredoxin oxidoreductase [Candidatus Coatesbacteria bacterium]|nr:indolepyruvate ferredoxin oxidoreductase [Candidatus Coatesbacteria bacterium]
MALKPTEIPTAPAGTRELMMGNHALVRAFCEAGVRVVTTYPGSPTPEIAAGLLAAKPEGIYFEYSINEIVATEYAFGAALAGAPSCVFFKSVGLNVAADAFVQLPLYELPGGLVVIVGDDPSALSSQNEQDNRRYARLCYMPMLEPSNAVEAKEMFVYASRLAREHRTAIMLRLTTRIAHGSMEIEFGELPGEPVEAAGVPDKRQVPIAADAVAMKGLALQRLVDFARYVEEDRWNYRLKQEGEDAGFGIVCGGAAYGATRSALRLLGRGAEILKLGFSYPLPRKKLVEFCRDHDEVLVVEELDPVVEEELKVIAYEEGLSCRISGLGKYARAEDFSAQQAELDPGRLAALLGGRLGVEYPLETLDLSAGAPKRLPQLCPGCGHRTAVYGTKMAVGRRGHAQADIGCHTMSYFPPYELGESLVCMGAGPTIAQGVKQVLPESKVTSFLGDSTFFHAGIEGVINAVWNNHDVTILLMDNQITAMTGHQPNPHSGRGPAGSRPEIEPRRILESIGVGHVEEVDAWRIDEVREAVKRGLEHAGPAVVVLRHPCMLYTTRQWKRERKMPPPYRVDQEKCALRKTCIKYFACPAFGFDGERVRIDPELCIGCGCCAQVCPEGAIVQDTEYERAY